jgi:hypothetical protein
MLDEDELEPEDDCDEETEELDEFEDDDELEDEEVTTEPGLPGAPEMITDPGVPAAPDDELPSENEACLIAFNTPCRQRIAASWPEENPEIERRGWSRHATWPTEIRSGPSAEIFPVANCAVGRPWLAPATPVETSITVIATTSHRRIATKSADLEASCQRASPPMTDPLTPRTALTHGHRTHDSRWKERRSTRLRSRRMNTS